MFEAMFTNIEIQKLFTIIKKPMLQLEYKFTRMLPGENEGADEYWLLILKKIERYLFEYELTKCYYNNLFISRLKYIENFIDWFNLEWPARRNKRHIYKYPKYLQPLEVFS
jgi:hypothetical protein